MNILILSWRGPGHPNAGGAEIATFHHAKAWIAAGHQVTLFTSHYHGSKDEEIVDGIKIIRSGGQVIGVKWQAFRWYLSGNHQKFDLVIDEFHGLPFFTPLYIRTKKLAYIHEVAKEVWWLNPWPKPLNLLPGLVGSLIEPIIFWLFYRQMPFMTVSNSTKDDLINWGVNQRGITIVHNGFDLEKIDLKTKEQYPTITYLGSLSKDKGIEDALKTFQLIQQQLPEANFWIIGKADEQYLAQLKEKVEKLGIENLTFWGFVSQQKKYQLLSASSILFNPSIREGWGLVIIEANACATPAVGYRVPGLKDSILDQKTGLLCDPNPQSAAETILKLLKDKKSYHRYQLAARKWSQTFSWEESTKQSLKLIEQIIKGGSN